MRHVLKEEGKVNEHDGRGGKRRRGGRGVDEVYTIGISETWVCRRKEEMDT